MIMVINLVNGESLLGSLSRAELILNSFGGSFRYDLDKLGLRQTKNYY